MKRHFIKYLLSCIGMLAAVHAHAETGVSESSIVVGHSIALSGPLGELGTEYKNGAALYFAHVNKRGGVHGRTIKLISLDDAYNTDKAMANTRRLVEQEKVFAIFGQFGTGITQSSLPLTTAAGVPLFAPYTGADALRDDANRYLFHIRASYGDETESIIEQLVSTGVRQIAVVYQDDAFGKAGLQGAERALAKRDLKPVAVGAIEMPAVDTRKALEATLSARPGAIVMITAGKPSVAFIREYIKTGTPTQFFALSVVSSRQLVQELGPASRGVVISQVMPSPWRNSHPVVREYQQLLGKSNQEAIGYTSLEGFIAAKVFTEAVKRAGKELTREKFVTALEGLRYHDVGGLVVDFGPDKRKGSSYVELTIINKTGQFLR